MNVLAENAGEKRVQSSYRDTFADQSHLQRLHRGTFGPNEREKFDRKISILQSFTDHDGQSNDFVEQEFAEEEDDFRFIDEVIAGYMKDI